MHNDNMNCVSVCDCKEAKEPRPTLSEFLRKLEDLSNENFDLAKSIRDNLYGATPENEMKGEKEMSDRKFARGAMRAYARKHGIKESKYVHVMFDRLQVKTWGKTGRKIHQAIGTKPKRLWRLRISDALGN